MVICYQAKESIIGRQDVLAFVLNAQMSSFIGSAGSYTNNVNGAFRKISHDIFQDKRSFGDIKLINLVTYVNNMTVNIL